MLGDAVRSWWAEPRVPDPPARVRRDRALAAVLAAVAVLEGALREGLVWPVVSVVVAVALLPTLLWRRTHPLATVVVAFGTLSVVDVVSLSLGAAWEGVASNAFVLLLLYALFRWGSGRHAAIGLAVTAVPLLLGVAGQATATPADDLSTSDLVGGGLVLLATAAIGAAVRYQDNAHQRGLDQVKLLEREQLARELHDTVAHHVSAIALRAQAGRVVGASDPAAALDALVVIEGEASRTLEEMRTIVGVLRRDREPDLTPMRGVADIERLTGPVGGSPVVAVELSGDLTDLRPSVDAAVYRLAQESITNAVRHARHATRIRVSVRGEADCVHLTVGDDGDAVAADPRSPSGFGLIGMAERASLLGGTLEAGPDRDRGWTVRAVLPRDRARS